MEGDSIVLSVVRLGQCWRIMLCSRWSVLYVDLLYCFAIHWEDVSLYCYSEDVSGT